ncbi:amidohydrolase family protein [Amycolatopsis pithecellobii]|uniref:Amidohydrolase family protein n=1 Tax=Amycolatopsis pithecellobii TaxID=664692 RepID=A0A6N7Z3H8_9PSEU|nr:amidohydrolase family protein [Amycolatopsis pithecellobii]MTD54700.1 amidohydrolase family protein [Amycolatopsis pithecellobii]
MPVGAWIDVHAHFFPPESDDERQARVDALRQAGWCIDRMDSWDARRTLDAMDRTGIQMQMLSYVPPEHHLVRAANDYGAELVGEYPDRFGLLAALPTDDPDACLAEIRRVPAELRADGFAVQSLYRGVHLGDSRLEPVWAELNSRKAVVFAHPNAYGSEMGRPTALFEVAFQTARIFVDMLYSGVFRRYPEIRFVVAHGGGGLPAISGRLALLGHERWVPNPGRITPAEMRQHLRRLYVDTAATMPTALAPALHMTTPDHILYGSDSGVPCTTDATVEANLIALLECGELTTDQKHRVGRNALALFPAAAERIAAA